MAERQCLYRSVGTLVMACVTACTPAPDAEHVKLRPPTMRVAAAEHDFGRVRQGSVVEHVYRVENTGDLDLRLTDVRAACGCAAAVPSPDRIAPGGDGIVRATFDTSDYFGQVRRTITLASNDPEQPSVSLVLRGVVDVEVAVDPPAVYLGRIQRGADAGRGARIVVREGSSLRVRVLGTEGKALVPTIVGDEVRFAVRRDAAPGPFEDVVHLGTGSEHLPRIDVAVAGIVETAGKR